MALVRGHSDSGRFGIFGRIFQARIQQAQPIGDGGLLDGLDDDDVSAAEIEAQLQADNAAYLMALGVAMGAVGDSIPHLPVDNVVAFPTRRSQQHV